MACAQLIYADVSWAGCALNSIISRGNGPRERALGASAFRRLVLLGGSLPLVMLALAAAHWARNVDFAPQAIDLTAVAAAPATSAAVQPEGPDSVEVTVQRNDTLDRIFRSVGLDLGTLAELRARPEVRKALDVLRPGDIITLTHVNGVLQSLNRQISDTLTLSIARAGDDYAVNLIENPLETQVAVRHATITSSLFEAGQQAGITAATIMTLATEMFGWDIDFALDIREGDEFNVLYEQQFQDGRYVNDGRVLAAEFVNQGKVHRAVWFESKDGAVKGYFAPDGHGMRKAFLRAPLDFTRISSAFNSRRLHPILGIVRAHKGTDYAAPTGTRVWAAGDGRIAFVGQKGGYGNVMVVDHGRGITTVYGHLSRFGSGMRVGRRVQQGETIGYVGMTGLATGPHLHYEYLVNGQQRNPSKIALPRSEIPAPYVAEFRQQSAASLARLEQSSAPAARVASR